MSSTAVPHRAALSARSQIRTRLEQVLRVRMAQRVRTDATIDAGDRRGTAHRVPDASGRERLVGTPAEFLAWEEVRLRRRTMRRLSMSATFSWNVASAGPFRHAGVAEVSSQVVPPCDAPYALRPTTHPAARRPPRQRLRSGRPVLSNPPRTRSKSHFRVGRRTAAVKSARVLLQALSSIATVILSVPFSGRSSPSRNPRP